MTIGGTRDELALVAVALAALTERQQAHGRAVPPGVTDLRNQLSVVLSRQDPSTRDIDEIMSEGAPVTPLLLTLDEAGSALRSSRSTIERVVKAGDLKVVHVGRAARIRPEDLHEYVRKLAGEPSPVRGPGPLPATDSPPATDGTLQ